MIMWILFIETNYLKKMKALKKLKIIKDKDQMLNLKILSGVLVMLN